MADNIKEMFVVEWSRSQKHFHIHSLEEMLEANLQAALHGKESDYVVIAILPTESEADEAAIIIETKMREHGRL